MKKYSSIDQFRQVVRDVHSKHDFQGLDEEQKPIYKHLSDYPTLAFKGTVKAHGTNAGIVKYKDGTIEFQSRERVLTLDQDNAGFMARFVDKDLHYLFNQFECKEYVAIYGEWCGGSIQKGVAVSQLPKMFIVFGLKIDDIWYDSNLVLRCPDHRVFNINQFKTFTVDIDFNSPQLVQNKIIEQTISVENKCPIGEYFGVDGIGEGVVYTCVTDLDLKFKSKGEKHSASKVKILGAVDTEQLKNIAEFVEYAVTENRLNQGLQYLKENSFECSAKSTGDFIRWVCNDIIKEESDTIASNGFEFKQASNLVAAKSRAWFLNNF